MSNFLASLWTSIFTPGPTPPLLAATNGTFAALQVLLLALLIATYSVHFIALSVISAGLWWGINWFAREIILVKEHEERAKREGDGKGGLREKEKDKDRERDAREETPVAKPPSGTGGVREEDEGDVDTATEDEGAAGTEVEDSTASLIPEAVKEPETPVEQGSATAGAERAGAATGLQPPAAGDAHRRKASERSDASSTGELSTSASTDSEWEKVSESGER